MIALLQEDVRDQSGPGLDVGASKTDLAVAAARRSTAEVLNLHDGLASLDFSWGNLRFCLTYLLGDRLDDRTSPRVDTCF